MNKPATAATFRVVKRSPPVNDTSQWASNSVVMGRPGVQHVVKNDLQGPRLQQFGEPLTGDGS